ncbi:hypothetical protein LUZ60_004963 [Juncus effusus]|nr:hypothetical protein LUZ60_004963 [Juncus effusus]
MSNCIMECGGARKEANWVSHYDSTNQADESEIMAQFFSQDLNYSSQAFAWNEFEFSDTSNLNLNSNPSENESYYLNDSNEALGININSLPPSVDMSLFQEQQINQYLNLITNPNPNYDATNEELLRGDSRMNLPEPIGLSEQTLQHKRKFYELDNSSECPEKMNAQVQKGGRKNKSKIARKGEEDERNGDLDGSSCNNGYNSDDDSNGSGSMSPRSKGKARAGRGSATDPQSLYARKRREKINERLRILQNIVPNGTKVDISTMLEEAVQYVKFLQIQIKMLSSDEMWMYSPIAYNGMNLGLDLKIMTPQF